MMKPGKPEEISITRVWESDLEKLQHISTETFIQAFGKFNTSENMQHYISHELSRDSLHRQLNHPHSEFYFATADEQVIGYLKLNSGDAQTDLQGGIEIERIYICDPYQRGGIGRVLLDKAIQRARDNGHDHVWLGVWDKNYKAISFYEKNGFIAFGSHGFQLGDDLQTDVLMRLALQ